MFDTPLTKGRQALQGHAEGNQCFISDLNLFRFSISLKNLGRSSQIFGPRKDSQSFPLCYYRGKSVTQISMDNSAPR